MLIISLKIHTKVTQSILYLTFSMYLSNHTMFKLHWAMMIGYPQNLQCCPNMFILTFLCMWTLDKRIYTFFFFFFSFFIIIYIAVKKEKKREVFNMCATKPGNQPNNDHRIFTSFFSLDCHCLSVTLKGFTSSIKVHCT